MSETKPKSERNLICEHIATFLIENNLCNPFGGDVDLSRDRRSYITAFSIPRLLDGSVQVFSPKFILVRTAGPLSRFGDGVFESEANVLAYLRAAFVEYDSEKADSVPRKQR